MPYKDPEQKARWMRENRHRYEVSRDPKPTPETADKITIDTTGLDGESKEILKEEIEATQNRIRAHSKFISKYPQYASNSDEKGEGGVINQKEEKNVNKGKVKN